MVLADEVTRAADRLKLAHLTPPPAWPRSVPPRIAAAFFSTSSTMCSIIRSAADGVVGLAGGIDHVPPRAAAGDADIGHQRLARAVHHAADDRQRHRRLDMRQPLLQLRHRLDDVEALPRAGRAGDDLHPAMADAERLQDLPADMHLLLRLGRERDADGVADAGPQQAAQPDRRLFTVPVRRPPASVMPICSG